MSEWLRIKKTNGTEGIIRVEDIVSIESDGSGLVLVEHRYGSKTIAVQGSLDDFVAALTAGTIAAQPDVTAKAWSMRPIPPEGDPTMPCTPGACVDVICSNGQCAMYNVRADSVDWAYVAGWRHAGL